MISKPQPKIYIVNDSEDTMYNDVTGTSLRSELLGGEGRVSFSDFPAPEHEYVYMGTELLGVECTALEV